MIKILYPIIILPKFFRDFVYDLIAKNRYKLFGKTDSCRIPTEEEKLKFLF
jgi:predicted DCC family thiol-disulfide oxidoreductase YuxK